MNPEDKTLLKKTRICIFIKVPPKTGVKSICVPRISFFKAAKKIGVVLQELRNACPH